MYRLDPISKRTTWGWVIACLLASVCPLASRSNAQQPNYAQSGTPPERGLGLLQEEPHDLVFFTEKAGGGWAKVTLLDFPGRTPPTDRTGALKFQVLGIEGQGLRLQVGGR